jgi:hypothetical protein
MPVRLTDDEDASMNAYASLQHRMPTANQPPPMPTSNQLLQMASSPRTPIRSDRIVEENSLQHVAVNNCNMLEIIQIRRDIKDVKTMLIALTKKVDEIISVSNFHFI